MRRTAFVLATFSLLGLAAPGLTQEEPPPADVPVFGTESAVVLLDVVVRDNKGRLVRDLAASELEVYEDGEKQDVSAFSIFDGGWERPGPATPEESEARRDRASGSTEDQRTTSPPGSE